MAKIGMDLPVTLRPNIWTSNGWRWLQLDDVLDLIETDPAMKEFQSSTLDGFLQQDGWISSEGQEAPDDYLITPTQLQEPHKEAFREQKKTLRCVNYFGMLLPPSNDTQLQGQGQGVVVLDIDIKEFAHEGPLPSAFLETVENHLYNFFFLHPSTLFLYKTASSIDYHMGFLTNARDADQYKRTFQTLLKEIKEKVPILNKNKVLDPSGGNCHRPYFISHSPVVLRKKPTASVPVPEVEEQPTTTKEKTKAKEPQHGTYKEFPYNPDFRLFLAQKRMQKGIYFDDFLEWTTLIYALLNVYTLAYKERLEYWFETLSLLAPDAYDQEHNMEIFESIIYRDDVDKRTGIEYILYKLNGDQRVSSRPHYSLEDIKEYFETLEDYDRPSFEFSDFLFINRYLSEIKSKLNLRRNLAIESPPNSGKSSLLLTETDFKIIFLVPTLILLEDLKKKVDPNELQVVNQDVKREDIDPSKRVIISTYEGLEKIVNCGIILKEYTLVVDECHNLFTASAPFFRYKTMRYVVRCLGMFHNFILLSGTLIPFPFTKLPFTLIKVRLKNPMQTELELVHTPTPLDTLTMDVLAEQGKQIVLINNRTENNVLKENVLLKRPQAPIIVVNRDTKGYDDVSAVFATNTLPQGGLMVGTQMIAEGVSIVDADIAAIRFYRLMIPELVAQFSFRVRSHGSKPSIAFYHAAKDFILTGLTYDNIYQAKLNNAQQENLMDMGREYIDPQSGLMIYYKQDPKKKKGARIYSSYVREQGRERLDELLLGYNTLQRAAQLMNMDLFAVLAALRKWYFTFSFSSKEGTTVRKHFKDLRLAQHVDIIENNFSALLDRSYTRESFLPGTPLFKAWVVLRSMKLEYFLNLDAQRRVDLFTQRKMYQDFLQQVAGTMLLRDKMEGELYEQLSKDFKVEDEPVLTRIAQVKGFPDKIFHDDLKAAFPNLKLSVQKIKNILAKQFTVSKTKTGSSEKYFSLTQIEHDFEAYIKWDEMLPFSTNFLI